MTWKDIEKIEHILTDVKREYNNLPYDQIPWAEVEGAVYKETLRRFNEKMANKNANLTRRQRKEDIEDFLEWEREMKEDRRNGAWTD